MPTYNMNKDNSAEQMAAAVNSLRKDVCARRQEIIDMQDGEEQKALANKYVDAIEQALDAIQHFVDIEMLRTASLLLNIIVITHSGDEEFLTGITEFMYVRALLGSGVFSPVAGNA